MKKFAMITHLTGLKSHENFIYYPILNLVLRVVPQEVLKKWIPLLPPHRILNVYNITSENGKTTQGVGIMCPLLPEQFLRFSEQDVLARILKSCRKAQSLGADIIGLAAFTSVVGNEGQYISENSNINVTSGNTYTAFLAIDSILKATKMLNINASKINLVVLGATGDIGSICAKVLAESFSHITIVARNSEKLSHLVASLPKTNTIEIEKNPEKAVASGDVILCVTSSVFPLFDVGVLKAGSIFCDVSIPSAIPKIKKNFRKDVLIYDGGKAMLPNVEIVKGDKWKRLFPNNVIFGCLAETILLALEERMENFSVGRGNITIDKINQVKDMSLRHGFSTAPFSFGDYAYTQEDFDVIKKARIL